MRKYILFDLLLASFFALLVVQEANAQEERLPKPVIALLDKFLFTTIPKLLNQRPFNENGTFSQNAKFLYRDQSNENVGTASLQELIVRAGYKYANHYVLSPDGYITQLTRLINPRADPQKLRQPPVAMFHGGIINPTAYVVSSNIQHHPERYPRLPGDYHTSSNRSIAFVLANNGFDVWLIGTRGASRENQGHLKYKVFQPRGFLARDEWVDKPMSVLNETREVYQLFKYWDFTMDDIAEFEFPAQVDKILQVTGAKKVTFFTYSFSTIIGLPVLATNEEFSKKVHNLILMAPIVNKKGANRFLGILYPILSRLEYNLGTVLFSVIAFSQTVRDILLSIGFNRDFRYTITKAFIGYIAGSSPKYYTLLAAPVIGHIFEPVGFREFQHYVQQVVAGRLQKYDYGIERNQQEYGQFKPPVYDLSKISVKNWMLISAEDDNLSTPGSVRQTLRQLRFPPQARSFYPKANHVDLFAGFDVDRYVNLPILKYLIKNALPPLTFPPEAPTLEQLEFQNELISLVPADTTLIRASETSS